MHPTKPTPPAALTIHDPIVSEVMTEIALDYFPDGVRFITFPEEE